MNTKNFESALDDVIKKFQEDAGTAINYCPSDEISTPLAETHKAFATALKSIKDILVAEKYQS